MRECCIQFIMLAEILPGNLINFKSPSAQSWIIPLYETDTIWFILD